jgi:hypothetical protein
VVDSAIARYLETDYSRRKFSTVSTLLDSPTEDILHNRQQTLQSRVLLLAPSFSFWRGYYQISTDRVSVSVDQQDVRDSDVTTPRAILMKDTCPRDSTGKAWKKRFAEIERVGSRLIEAFSVPFPIRGVRIIPKSHGREFFDKLIGTMDNSGRPMAIPGRELGSQSVAYQLWVAADEFCNNLDSVYDQIQAATPASIWNAIRSKLPADRGAMRQKFHIDAVPIELAGGAANDVTREDMAAHQQVVQAACRRKVEEAVEEMIRGPRAELAQSLADLRDLVSRDGNVTDRSFNAVRGAIAKLRRFDFVANEDLLQQINTLAGRIERTDARTLDSVTAANNGFTDALTVVYNEVVDDLAIATDIDRFGRERRGIDLD